MYSCQSKKLIIICILEILKKYTDCEHTLSQKEIAEKLEKDYDIRVDRKAVKRNITELIEFGYPIEFSEKTRMTLNKKSGEYEENSLMSDLYISREFDDSELRLLIDSIVFSRHIPQGDKKRLTEKLERLSNIYFRSPAKYIVSLQNSKEKVNAIFYTIDTLTKAMEKGRQVICHYDEYGTDKQLHHRKNSEGKVREYVLNPYQIAASNGRYYLICNNDKYDGLSNYRLDRISDIRMSDKRRKPLRKIEGIGDGFNLKKYLDQHIYMSFSSPTDTVDVTFLADKSILNDIFDYFGRDISFKDETDETVKVCASVARQDMLMWAMQFATKVTVLKPVSLADECKKKLTEAVKRYD